MGENFANAAQTTLNGAINDTVTSITVTSSSLFPAAPFRARIKAEGANADEIILVTNVSGTTWTVTRAYEDYAGSSAASSHANGATVEQVITAGMLGDLYRTPTGTIGAKVYHNTTQSASASGTTYLTFNSEEFDTDNFHDGTNPTRLTIPAGLGGKYIVGAVATSATNTIHQALFRLNGTTIVKGSVMDAGFTSGFSAHYQTVLDLNAGDYIEFGVYVVSASTIEANGGERNTTFWLIKLDSGTVGQAVGAKAYHSTTQGTLAQATVNALNLDTEEFDTDGFHSTTSNTSRMTIPAGLAGKYLIIGKCKINQSAQRYLRKNGTTLLRGGATGAADNVEEVVAVADLVAGDYIELCEYHSAGGDGTAGDASNDHLRTELSIMRLDSQPKVPSPTNTIGASATVTSQTISNAAWTPVTFNTVELYDTDGFHDLSTNPSRFTIPAGLSGKYLIMVDLLWDADASSAGSRYTKFYVNGSTPTGEYNWRTGSHSVDTGHQRVAVLHLNSGDYVETVVYQDRGGNLDIQGGKMTIIKLDSGTIGAGSYALVVRNTDGALGSGEGTYTAVPWDGADIIDTDSYHDSSTNNTRLTVPLAGVYRIDVGFLKSNTHQSVIRVNGTTYPKGVNYQRSVQDGYGGAWTSQLTTVLSLNAGDYVEVMQSGSSGTIYADSSYAFIELLNHSLPKAATPDFTPFGLTVVGTASAEGASPLSITKPAGTQDGDLLILAGMFTNSVPNASGPDGDSSWTQIVRNDTSSNEYHAVYYKIASSEASSWTWTHSGGTDVAAALAVVRGYSTFIDSSYADNTLSTVSCNGELQGIQIVVWLTTTVGGSQFTTPSSFTELIYKQATSTNNPQVLISYIGTAWNGPTLLFRPGGSSADNSYAGAVSMTFK